jgi:hypothetical protein
MPFVAVRRPLGGDFLDQLEVRFRALGINADRVEDQCFHGRAVSTRVRD